MELLRERGYLSNSIGVYLAEKTLEKGAEKLQEEIPDSSARSSAPWYDRTVARVPAIFTVSAALDLLEPWPCTRIMLSWRTKIEL